MQAMTQNSFVHKPQRYLVAGLGLTGFSVARYLLKQGYDCRIIDDREQPPYAKKLQDRKSVV